MGVRRSTSVFIPTLPRDSSEGAPTRLKSPKASKATLLRTGLWRRRIGRRRNVVVARCTRLVLRREFRIALRLSLLGARALGLVASWVECEHRLHRRRRRTLDSRATCCGLDLERTIPRGLERTVPRGHSSAHSTWLLCMSIVKPLKETWTLSAQSPASIRLHGPSTTPTSPTESLSPNGMSDATLRSLHQVMSLHCTSLSRL